LNEEAKCWNRTNERINSL